MVMVTDVELEIDYLVRQGFDTGKGLRYYGLATLLEAMELAKQLVWDEEATRDVMIYKRDLVGMYHPFKVIKLVIGDADYENSVRQSSGSQKLGQQDVPSSPPLSS